MKKRKKKGNKNQEVGNKNQEVGNKNQEVGNKNQEVERLELALLKIAYWTQCRYSFNIAAESLGNKTADDIIKMGKAKGW